jgi:aldose 1-epimerase
MRNALGVGVATLLAAQAQAAPPSATRADFGTLADGRAVEAVTLDNGKGMRARILSYGAILQSLEAPDRKGQSADIVLGYAEPQLYVSKRNFFGATVGRYANRIAHGRFTLDDKSYQVPTGGHPHALHGGDKGFDAQMWKIVALKKGPYPSVTLSYVSADGEEGFPGRLRVTATYTLTANNELRIEYLARTNKPTIVNMTNHSYFNLSGEGSEYSVLGHRLTVPASRFTPVDSGLIPTGELRSVEGTPFDFRKPVTIGAHVREVGNDQLHYGSGYDENLVVTEAATTDPHLMARVEDPVSGRVLELLSNQPGIQVYSGNGLNGSAVGPSGHAYRQGDGLALEPELFPDTPNHPAFGSARLDPGKTYRNIIVYRLSVLDAAGGN